MVAVRKVVKARTRVKKALPPPKPKPKPKSPLRSTNLIGIASETIQNYSPGEYALPSVLIKEAGTSRRVSYMPTLYEPEYFSAGDRHSILIYEFLAGEAISAIAEGRFSIRQKRFDPPWCDDHS